MLLLSFVLLVCPHQSGRSIGAINRTASDYGSTAINIKGSNENKSRYGSLKEPFVMLRVLEFATDDGRTSMALCNTAFNEATDFMIDSLFRSLLPTEALQNKLMETSVFRKSTIDTSQISHINVMLRSLVQCRFKFVRGLDMTQSPFILFSLSSNIPSLFKRAQNQQVRQFNIIITFNETGMQSLNAQNFTLSDFIYLLEYDKVYASLGNEGAIQEWMHISDQISKQKLFNRMRCGISKGGAGLILIGQFLFCFLHSNHDNSVYYEFSLSMTKIVGCCVGLFWSAAFAVMLSQHSVFLCCPIFIALAILISKHTIKLFYNLAIDHPAFNGVISAVFMSSIWLSWLGLLDYFANRK